MLYSKYPYERKRYPNPGTGQKASAGGSVRNDTRPNTVTVEIPSPDKAESSADIEHIRHPSYQPSIIDFFKSRIKVDELILLGLIVLFLQENIEDDFLMIILLYILLTGRE